MIKKYSTQLFIVLTLCTVFSHPAYSADIKNLLKKYAESIVLVKTDNGAGTGFFINAYGTVLTCRHVIQGAKTIQVRWEDAFADAELIYTGENYDQALINICKENTPYLSVQKHIVERILDKKLMKASDTVTITGYPFASAELQATTGKITEIYYQYEADEPLSGVLENIIYQTDAPAYPGNSGSPVFNSEGIVIGMASAIKDPGKGTGISRVSFIYSPDQVLSYNRLLFQSLYSESGGISLYKETESCNQNTNPYYFRHENCGSDSSGSFYYKCPRKSCGKASYRDIFAGSFLGIPLYASCRPTIIPRHFLSFSYSKEFEDFLYQVAGNPHLKNIFGRNRIF